MRGKVRWRPAAALLPALAMLVAIPAAAGEKAREGDGKVVLVSWKVELSGGVQARLMAPVGEMVQVTRPDGTTIGMVPRLKTGNPAGVVFDIFDVKGDPNREKQEPSKLDIVEAKTGVVTLSTKVSDLALTLLSVKKVDTEKPAAPPAKDNRPEAGARLVRWSLALANDQNIDLVGIDGEESELRLSDGRLFYFVPKVEDADRVTFSVYSAGTAGATGRLGLKRFEERFSMETGAEYFPAVLADSLIKITGIREITQADFRAELAKADPRQRKGCCVTCGTTRACGCAVSMDCGDCCVPPCCYLEF